jgi:hypothetical protein
MWRFCVLWPAVASARVPDVSQEHAESSGRTDEVLFHKAAGLPSPATVVHELAPLPSIDAIGRVATKPHSGDLGM